jgi:uncharacterized protein YcfJ
MPQKHAQADSAEGRVAKLRGIAEPAITIISAGLSGRQVANKARRATPGNKVLLTSGYAGELVRGDDVEREQLRVRRNPCCSIFQCVTPCIGRRWR